MRTSRRRAGCVDARIAAGRSLMLAQEVDEIGQGILTAEEVLLDALCFDFVVDSPHFDLVTLFDMHQLPDMLHDHAFSIANDTSVL